MYCENFAHVSFKNNQFWRGGWNGERKSAEQNESHSFKDFVTGISDLTAKCILPPLSSPASQISLVSTPSKATAMDRMFVSPCQIHIVKP